MPIKYFFLISNGMSQIIKNSQSESVAQAKKKIPNGKYIFHKDHHQMIQTAFYVNARYVQRFM
jgi:hypothetical protein